MAAITKKRRLRTGNGGYSADSATLTDTWLITVDEQINKRTFLELCYLDPDLPKPKETFEPLGANFVVCDWVDGEPYNNQRYIWQLNIRWKELSDSEPKDQTRPVPTIDSVDPEDWSPTVTRRPVTVLEPAQSLFYEGGYSGEAHAKYQAQVTAVPSERSPVTNSALVPFEDNLPPHQRKQSLWTFRWLRAEVPAGLVNKELKLNNADLTFSHRGYTETWKVKCAKIESVQLSQTKWGNLQLWEIVIEVLHDPDGHFVTTLDKGLAETYWTGQTLGGLPVASKVTVPIKDYKKRPVSEPCLLNGDGKELPEGGTEKYGKWRDSELYAFESIALLGDLLSVVVP